MSLMNKSSVIFMHMEKMGLSCRGSRMRCLEKFKFHPFPRLFLLLLLTPFKRPLGTTVKVSASAGNAGLFPSNTRGTPLQPLHGSDCRLLPALMSGIMRTLRAAGWEGGGNTRMALRCIRVCRRSSPSPRSWDTSNLTGLYRSISV
ncbi:hypothetical protein Bbelb_213370 [Branchiostoma belcheri]|nr:hypothetical protein Bbelb_213370 [Branchiostoma belcheri]